MISRLIVGLVAVKAFQLVRRIAAENAARAQLDACARLAAPLAVIALMTTPTPDHECAPGWADRQVVPE